MLSIRELQRRNVFRVAAAYAVVGWLLAEIGGLLFATFEAPVWVMKVFTSIIILGFPLALFLAWAFELTPDGLKREAQVDRSRSITNVTGRKFDRFIIIVLIAALGYFAFDKFGLDRSSPPDLVQATESTDTTAREKSIAVLPFVNMSDDAANEYFSDGISEEILNVLAKVKDLKVAGRTSSFSFKGRNQDLRTIGEALGVSHILEGSVRKAGVRVRITAQLIQADNGFHLWSETYDRELTDIFAVQDEIAQAIFAQLEAHLTDDRGAVTARGAVTFASTRTDISAYDLYLEAKHNIYLRKTEPLEQAADLLDRAISIDPDYAPAYAQKGITLLLLGDNQYGTIPAVEAASSAKVMLDRALLLDSASAEALAGRGLYLTVQGDHEQAVETLNRALSINPNMVDARGWLASAHYSLGHLEEVMRIRKEVLRRDPLFLPGIARLLDDYVLYGQFEQAQALLDRIEPYMPASRTMVSWSGVLHFNVGRVAESMPYFERAFEMEPNNPSSKNQLTRAYYYSGQYEQLFAMGLSEFEAYGLTHLGQADEALQVARELAASGNESALFRVLAAQRRYAELIEHVESNWADLQAFEVDNPERDGWSERNYMGLIAYAYQRTGNDEKFREALHRFNSALDYQRQIGANNSNFAFAEAVHALLTGDNDTALLRLSTAIEGGVTWDPNLSNSWPMFEVLDGDPKFEQIMNERLGQLNSERAKLNLEPI